MKQNNITKKNYLSTLSFATSFSLLLAVAIIFTFSNCGKKRPKVTLEVIRAFDSRLPTLSNEDMNEVLAEAKKVIKMKLGDHVDISFHDNGTISLDELFSSVDYSNNELYTQLKEWKYDLKRGKNMPFLKSKKFENSIVRFLKGYDLEKLRGFFPGRNIGSYEGMAVALMDAWHDKIKWLKKLKTKDGDFLVAKSKDGSAKKYQSYVEWQGFMHEQGKYDVVFTNSLIILDILSEPYPHAITKHSKVGGSSFTSPKREYFDGRSLLVNILEEYGEVKGISITKSSKRFDEKGNEISRKKTENNSLKNKILGGFLFAHEFGHAFYMIPDVYDHEDHCLMNSNNEQIDAEKGYLALFKNPVICKHCHPWLDAKIVAVKARIEFDRQNYEVAAELYLESAAATPEKLDADRTVYLKSLYVKAQEAYRLNEDKEGIEKVQKLIDDQGMAENNDKENKETKESK